MFQSLRRKRLELGKNPPIEPPKVILYGLLKLPLKMVQKVLQKMSPRAPQIHQKRVSSPRKKSKSNHLTPRIKIRIN